MIQLQCHLAGMWRRRELKVHHRLVAVVNLDHVHLFELFHS